MPIDFSDLGGRQVAPPPTKADAKPAPDLSDLYGEHGGIVAPAISDAKPEGSQPEE